jgi:hypothetical protein
MGYLNVRFDWRPMPTDAFHEFNTHTVLATKCNVPIRVRTGRMAAGRRSRLGELAYSTAAMTKIMTTTRLHNMVNNLRVTLLL